MAAKTMSCFTFLKEALVLPTRNPKLFTPVFLFTAAIAFLFPAMNVLFIQPLTADMLRHATEIKNTDPSSADYARLLKEIKQEARELIVITIALSLVTLVLSFAQQILSFFASSTTYAGDRYSLAELVLKVIRRNLRGPFITMAFVAVLEIACMALLTALLYSVMRHSRVLSAQGLVFLLAFLAFLYFNSVCMVSIAISVADKECRGIHALRQAWRLMTRVRRKEGLVLAVVIHLLPTLVSPLYVVALAYAPKSMALGLCLLSAYALLSAAWQLYDFTAVTVYYFVAMDTKEVTPYGYAKIPSAEANV